MATPLDLQEQEQLDELKAFWKQWGNLITWVITLVMLGFAGWNGWNWYQRDQAVKASGLFEALDRAVQEGDAQKSGRAFDDLKDRYPRTEFAGQGGLLAAKVLFEKGQADLARRNLQWVAENAVDDDLRSVARLRLAGVMLEAKQFDDALKQLEGAKSPAFAGLVADRRGDVHLAQGKTAEARTAYEAAFKGLDERVSYRQLVEAKLTALGVSPAASGVKP